eukprot:gene7365-13101_t
MSDAEFTAAYDEEILSDVSEEILEDGNIETMFQPYQDDPLASSCDKDDGENDETDINAIPLQTLEERFDRNQAVDDW